MDLHVFPDGEFVTITTMLSYTEHTGFEVPSTENLHEHHCISTRRWLHRLEAIAEEARHFFRVAVSPLRE